MNLICAPAARPGRGFAGRGQSLALPRVSSATPDSAVARLGPDALELERVLVSKSANDTRREVQLSGHLCQAPAASLV